MAMQQAKMGRYADRLGIGPEERAERTVRQRNAHVAVGGRKRPFQAP